MGEQQQHPTIKSHYVCTKCKNVILDYQKGYHIMGNVGFADPTCFKGIIGGGKWLDTKKIEDCPVNVFCESCLLNVLDIKIEGKR